ncbi:MAG: 30S ribosomal protein S17 [Candidatus Nealsonbacteria bacterium RIFCSPLOWO2_01_FULL_43_32]|uniref:Small ribosomal subunit protein uS17 n=1 Tax=Candidatus Nealsonbacteria bacterium RIFCSPLOWO2_01_FULL_43_32 TaxID=1801672 RepID=A0A1G2EFP7_9BACT|nr:MAG: 30S ribosomal protein S17 [Candidatus Nealsonbacteria bacterium RIFCSPLOWO2_01_FULL_43_32]
MPKKQLQGVITSNKMSKTVVVKVESVKVHPKYHKRFKVHQKYKAHTDQACNVGDGVIIEECRPLSKDKKWKVIKKIGDEASASSSTSSREAGLVI